MLIIRCSVTIVQVANCIIEDFKKLNHYIEIVLRKRYKLYNFRIDYNRQLALNVRSSITFAHVAQSSS